MGSDDVGLFMIIANSKRHPKNTETDQLPISEVITGLPRPYHNAVLWPTAATDGGEGSHRSSGTFYGQVTCVASPTKISFFADSSNRSATGRTSTSVFS